MSVALRPRDVTALTPIVDALDAVRARLGEAPVHGVTPSLMLPADADREWIPASRFADGSALPELLAAACLRWPGDPHVAGALAWKSYAYWVTMPVVVGFASARIVPNVAADNVRVRIHGDPPFVELGLIRPEVAQHANDDLLLATLRESLMDRHLELVLDQLHRLVRVGRRTLLGSVASAVCYALLRTREVPPGTSAARILADHVPESAAHVLADHALVPVANAILETLGLADLVAFGPDDAGRLTVARRTCCLAFALPSPRICSGCCIPADRLVR